MEDFKDAFAKIKKKPAGVLCSMFLSDGKWQFDFYDEGKDSVTSVCVGDVVKQSQSDKILKRDDELMEELKLSEIKVGFEQAMALYNGKARSAEKMIVSVYKKGVPTCNICGITKDFKMIEVKINAMTGNIIKVREIPIFSFQKQE